MMDENKKMKWQKDLETFFPLYNTFLLEGYTDDDQPCDGENGEVRYCRLCDYFDTVYTNNQDPKLNKRVIIYDPTESEEKRFDIRDNSYLYREEEPPADAEEQPADTSRPLRMVKEYPASSYMSYHFLEILENERLSPLLIDHRSSGPTLDIARIHFALTENTSRISEEELRGIFSQAAPADTGEPAAEDSAGGNEPGGYLFVIKMTSRLLSRDGQSNGLSEEELMIFRQLLSLAQELDGEEKDGEYSNKLIILANQIRDLPTWFTDEIANSFVKTITVSRPSEENKLDFFHEMLRDTDPACFTEGFRARYNEIAEAAGSDARGPLRNSIEKKFLAYTNDFGMNMLRRYRAYLWKHPLDIPDHLGFSVSSFRVGDMTNPWDDAARIKEMLSIEQKVSKKIKGQSQAMRAAQDILTRAAIGLDRAKNPNAPRVVLFLAGPTGTGKTELCKQLAECVFGSEERMVRFDMSEYQQPESDQKLFGAPPGYVGYEEGGKLTNAIKKEPFSLVLFDEIEKAHGSILDKFLQIIGDGRLTDGKGETVRFTDCIIAITTNAGVKGTKNLDRGGANGMENFEGEQDSDGQVDGESRPKINMDIQRVCKLETQGASPDEIYGLVREHLRYHVKEYFFEKLGRPELYGRIKNAIVYYNFIGRDSVKEIVSATIDDAVRSAAEARGIAGVESLDEVKEKLAVCCCDPKVRGLGARGIIDSTSEIFTGSLSNFIGDYIKEDRLEALTSKTLVCECKDTVSTIADIQWREA